MENIFRFIDIILNFKFSNDIFMICFFFIWFISSLTEGKHTDVWISSYKWWNDVIIWLEKYRNSLTNSAFHQSNKFLKFDRNFDCDICRYNVFALRNEKNTSHSTKAINFEERIKLKDWVENWLKPRLINSKTSSY